MRSDGEFLFPLSGHGSFGHAGKMYAVHQVVAAQTCELSRRIFRHRHTVITILSGPQCAQAVPIPTTVEI
jgi:hypothetical protein